MKYCKKCKKEYPENKKFCSDCGNELVKFVEDKEKASSQKRQISMKGPIILLVIFFFVLIVLGLLTNFLFSTTTGTTTPLGIGVNIPKDSERIDNLINEYNNYVGLFNSDNENMVNLYNIWVNVLNNAIEDDRLTNSEIAGMKTAIENYASEYKVVKRHLSNFRDFIVSNENYLKTQTTVAPFQMKTEIDDYNIELGNNVDYMTTKTQDLITSYQEQQQALGNLLKLLLGLGI